MESSDRGISFFNLSDAPNLIGSGVISEMTVSGELSMEDVLAAGEGGADSVVLFRGEGQSGFSLVLLRIEPGCKLPRHSHNADCLYYVVSGEAIMGRQIIRAGSGFFVKAGQPYAYAAGPDGVEVLEFRHATSVTMNITESQAGWVEVLARIQQRQELLG